MALTPEQQIALAKSKPDFIAHLKVTLNAVETFDQQQIQLETGVIHTKTVYSELVAPTKEHMDLAIKNYAGKYGALAIETITHQEYKDAQIDILIEKEKNESKT